jgi:formylglycine-generating enzyme required for sulfatase activity
MKRKVRVKPSKYIVLILAPFRFGALLAALVQSGCGGGSSPGPNEPPRETPAGSEVRLVPITNMVPIKAGTFVRGEYLVTLSRDFWVGKHEVTQAEYLAVTGKNPSHFHDHPDLPVEKVSHHDAVAYCACLTERERTAGRLPSGYEYRLPTEAEWEYACRAGTTNHFSFDSEAVADQYAWTSENSGDRTHPVGQKLPDPSGLHDIHGNVWEWTHDWFGPYPGRDTTDPKGPDDGKFKVFRGGGWDKELPYARSGNRFMMSPGNGIHFVGFRVALSQTANASSKQNASPR